MKISANELRIGALIEHKGKLWTACKLQHVKPGKGGAFVQAELKEIKNGTKLNERFRSDETLERVSLNEEDYQLLFRDGDVFTFMNISTFDQIQVNKDIMDRVKFDYHNLQHDPGVKNLDVVFCRNVMIYFDEPAQMVVLNNFWNSMAAHSYLFIGHSESLFGMDTKFEFLKTDWACLYQKKE